MEIPGQFSAEINTSRCVAAIALGEAGGIRAKATLEAVVAEAAYRDSARFAQYALHELAKAAA